MLPGYTCAMAYIYMKDKRQLGFLVVVFLSNSVSTGIIDVGYSVHLLVDFRDLNSSPLGKHFKHSHQPGLECLAVNG